MYRNFGIKEERLIFFGDVLGFKDMIKESEQQRVNSMLTALKMMQMNFLR